MDCISVEFWLMTGVFWVAGFAHEMVVFHTKKRVMGIQHPSPAVKYIVPVLLFFIWPYFYITRKAS